MAKKLFCPKCGAEFSEGDLFCVECGNKIEPRKPQESVIKGSNVETEETQIQYPFAEQTGKNEGAVIGRGEVYYFNSVWGLGKRGILSLTDTKLTFATFASKKERTLEILLKDIVIVKEYNFHSPWSIRVCLKDKEYIFKVRERSVWLDQINNAVKAVQNGNPKSTAKQKTDYIDEIKRLKELADAGIFSEAEFEAKKKSLLGL